MRARSPAMLARRDPCLALIATFLCTAAARPAVAAPSGAAAPAGDPRQGEAIYVGTVRLENGGAPCLGCHGVAGQGLARAASFGPDLTSASASWGDTLDAALAEMPFPSMQPIYAAHALTAVERRNLAAFLAESAARGEPPRIGLGFVLGVAGAAAGFLLLFAALRGRRARRRPSSRPARGVIP